MPANENKPDIRSDPESDPEANPRTSDGGGGGGSDFRKPGGVTRQTIYYIRNPNED